MSIRYSDRPITSPRSLSLSLSACGRRSIQHIDQPRLSSTRRPSLQPTDADLGRVSEWTPNENERSRPVGLASTSPQYPPPQPPPLASRVSADCNAATRRVSLLVVGAGARASLSSIYTYDHAPTECMIDCLFTKIPFNTLRKPE